MATATAIETRQPSKPALSDAVVVIAFGVLCTTLAQDYSLGKIPIQNLLKNELHAAGALNAAFFFWSAFPWYFKPLAGLLTDAFPIFGTRRRSYIVLGSACAAISWFVLAAAPHQYRPMLSITVAMNVFLTIASTAVGAYVVETGQATSQPGAFAALRQFAMQLSFVIDGPIAGYLATIAFMWTGISCGLVILLLVPLTVVFLSERRKQVDSRKLLDNSRRQLVRVGTTTTMWIVAAFMVLFYLAPGLQTRVFYQQQDVLHLLPPTQGFLRSLYGIGGIIAAVFYSLVCRRFKFRNILLLCMILAALGNLSYLFYNSLDSARVVATFDGFGFSLAEIALVDLAIPAIPVGCEGLGFSLLMSIRNFTFFGSDWLGAKLVDLHYLSFNSLVLVNGATTLLTVPLIFLLPQIVLRGRSPSPDLS